MREKGEEREREKAETNHKEKKGEGVREGGKRVRRERERERERSVRSAYDHVDCVTKSGLAAAGFGAAYAVAFFSRGLFLPPSLPNSLLTDCPTLLLPSSPPPHPTQ